MWTEVSAPPAADVARAFGVTVGELRSHPGGFEADAFTDGRWFLKLWRGRPDTDDALALTGRLAGRGLPVPAAVRAVDGGFTAGHQGRRYALFPFHPGRPGTWRQAGLIAAELRRLHGVSGLELPRVVLHEECIQQLRERRDHPWLGDRQQEVMAAVDRLEEVIERARDVVLPFVPCHRDLFPHNVLIGEKQEISALLDWGQARSAPREHDVFTGLCGPDPVGFLQAYGGTDLDLTRLEYARLARSVRDLAARIVAEVDLDGINSWGFAGLRRVDRDLALARPFCVDR